MRASGVLLPIFSLPGKYGIGCFSKEAYRFVDFLELAGQSFWQILPLGPTSYGDSPYQSFSTFAGNPYFISLEELVEQGLLTAEDCEKADFGNVDASIDYGQLYQARFEILKKAFKNKNLDADEEYKKFLTENDFWIHDYSEYMAIKNHFQAGMRGMRISDYVNRRLFLSIEKSWQRRFPSIASYSMNSIVNGRN